MVFGTDCEIVLFFVVVIFTEHCVELTICRALLAKQCYITIMSKQLVKRGIVSTHVNSHGATCIATELVTIYYTRKMSHFVSSHTS